MEGIDIFLLLLVWCAFNEIHYITIDGANREFGDNCGDTGAVKINVSYGLNNLDCGDGR